MAYAFSCKDVNRDCDYMAKADTFEKALKIVTGHFHEHHSITEMSPELRNKVTGAIRE